MQHPSKQPNCPCTGYPNTTVHVHRPASTCLQFLVSTSTRSFDQTSIRTCLVDRGTAIFGHAYAKQVWFVPTTNKQKQNVSTSTSPWPGKGRKSRVIFWWKKAAGSFASFTNQFFRAQFCSSFDSLLFHSGWHFCLFRAAHYAPSALAAAGR